jgi:hypothetical protein
MAGMYCSRYYEMPVEAAASYPERPVESTHLQGLVHCIQRLVALCQDNAHNCLLLANSDLMTKLLKGFTPILSVSETKFSGKCLGLVIFFFVVYSNSEGYKFVTFPHNHQHFCTSNLFYSDKSTVHNFGLFLNVCKYVISA